MPSTHAAGRQAGQSQRVGASVSLAPVEVRRQCRTTARPTQEIGLPDAEKEVYTARSYGHLLELQDLDVSRKVENVRYSWYEGKDNLHPASGETNPNPRKEEGYPFLKSPRSPGAVTEVGALARILVNYASGDEATKALVDGALSELGADISALFSIMGRHATRALECKLVADAMPDWVLELDPAEPVCVTYGIPEEAEGFGITGAPRGALGHWIKVEGARTANYQCVVPTTWNASPRDAEGQPGPMEQALTGLPV